MSYMVLGFLEQSTKESCMSHGGNMTLKLGNLGEFHKEIVYKDVSQV